MRNSLLLLVLMAQVVFATVTYTYDRAGRLVAVNYGSPGVLHYAYDNAGHIISRQLLPPASCNVSGGAATSVTDVQTLINEALGVIPAVHDLNVDGEVNVADIAVVINAALGLGCTAI